MEKSERSSRADRSWLDLTKEKGTKNDKKKEKIVKTKEKGANEMKAEQQARKQEQKGTRRQRKHEVDRKKELICGGVKNHLS